MPSSTKLAVQRVSNTSGSLDIGSLRSIIREHPLDPDEEAVVL